MQLCVVKCCQCSCDIGTTSSRLSVGLLWQAVLLWQRRRTVHDYHNNAVHFSLSCALYFITALLTCSQILFYTHRHTHTHCPFSRTTQVSRYQKGKTNLDFTEARDSEWQWHQLGYMQIYTLLQTNNHACTPPLSFLQAGCPSCRPTNSVKALKATRYYST